jgi:hypothetical protein
LGAVTADAGNIHDAFDAALDLFEEVANELGAVCATVHTLDGDPAAFVELEEHQLGHRDASCGFKTDTRTDPDRRILRILADVLRVFAAAWVAVRPTVGAGPGGPMRGAVSVT